MTRMSAKFVANRVGMSTNWVYELWRDMGLVMKDKFGDWALTDLGRQLGGRISKSNYCPVPTFEFEKIEQMMIDYYIENRK